MTDTVLALRTTAAPRPRRLALLALALVCAALIALVVLAPAARADEQALAHSEDGATQYYSINDAREAACSGTVVVMDDDWEMGSPLTLNEGQSAHIKMNGHRIYRDLSDDTSKGCVIWLEKKATLTLDGAGAEATFTIKKYGDGDEVEVTSGGLVTGGISSDSAGGVEMKEGATLKLVNVAVSGNQAFTDHGGGVAMNGESCTLEMTDAAIEYNKSYSGFFTKGCGGGVYINNEKTTISMTHSSITHNVAELGGGVYSDSGSTKIVMKEGSAIDENFVRRGNSQVVGHGAGVYFNKSYFTIEGDGTASISRNDALFYGSGVYICQKSSGTNEGTIKGVNFEKNSGGMKGAAIYDEQEYLTVEDCTFTGNETSNDGGAIYVDNDHTTIRNCTFIANKSGENGGAIYNNKKYTLIDGCTMTGNTAAVEGGAIWTSAYDDVELRGTVVIKGNARTDGASDDVFLNTLTGGGAAAYLTGSLEKGSKVGVRTGDTGDRRIAKDFSYSGYSPLFCDVEGYYVSYGTDSGGDAWQRHAAMEFQLTAEGRDLGTHGQGEAVTVSAATGDTDKAFWRWSADDSLGLDPFADYVPDACAATLSFAMPQNDVTLVAEYVARTGSVALTVDAPRAGEALPQAGTLSWADGEGGAHEVEVGVSWAEAAGGAASAAGEEARPGASYAVSAAVGMDGGAGLAFALDMGAADVAVRFQRADGSLVDVGAASASVDAATETLSLTSNAYALPKARLAAVTPARVTVAEGASEAELRALLPTAAAGTDELGGAVALTADPSSADLSALLAGGLVVSPESGQAKVAVPVSSDAVDNPDGLALEVTVTVEPTYLAVAFDAAGGSPEPGAQSVRWGACAQEPEAPERAGWSFLGWYAEGAGEAWDFSAPVTQALKLTARWEPACTVTFDPANGQEPFSQGVVTGEFALEPAEPAREGHEFLGWYTAGGSLYRFNEPVVADLALTARWEALPPTEFDDVPAGSWFHGWVAQASSLRLMTGYRDDSGAYTGLFGPDDALTRGQVATVLWRLAGCPDAADGGSFPDVAAGEFYSTAVSWCASAGVVTGYEAGPNEGLFLPEAGVTREELAVMLWRFERWASVDVADPPTAAFDALEDGASVSAWAREACVWCAAAGVMTGKETAEGTLRLDPGQGATRAQAAKMLVRAYRILWREVDPYAGDQEAQASAQAADAQAAQAAGAVQAEAPEAPTFDDVTFEAEAPALADEADAQPEAGDVVQPAGNGSYDATEADEQPADSAAVAADAQVATDTGYQTPLAA